MSGEGSSSRGGRFFRGMTVALTFVFVLLQSGVFIYRALNHTPRREAAPLIIHDTVYVGLPVPSAVPSPAVRSGPMKKRVVASLPEEDTTASGSGENLRTHRAVTGDSGWKWDVVELNGADSAALDELPGVGGYYARSILRYRARLGAFTEPGQLLEIRGMDSARFVRIAPRVRIDSSYIQWMDLRTVEEEVLSRHPYVGKMAARGIVRLRGALPPEDFSLDAVVSNGILDSAAAARLGRYLKK